MSITVLIYATWAVVTLLVMLLAVKIVLLVTFVATTNRLFIDRLHDLLSVNSYFAVAVFLCNAQSFPVT